MHICIHVRRSGAAHSACIEKFCTGLALPCNGFTQKLSRVMYCVNIGSRTSPLPYARPPAKLF